MVFLKISKSIITHKSKTISGKTQTIQRLFASDFLSLEETIKETQKDVEGVTQPKEETTPENKTNTNQNKNISSIQTNTKENQPSNKEIFLAEDTKTNTEPKAKEETKKVKVELSKNSGNSENSGNSGNPKKIDNSEESNTDTIKKLKSDCHLCRAPVYYNNVNKKFLFNKKLFIESHESKKSSMRSFRPYKYGRMPMYPPQSPFPYYMEMPNPYSNYQMPYYIRNPRRLHREVSRPPLRPLDSRIPRASQISNFGSEPAEVHPGRFRNEPKPQNHVQREQQHFKEPYNAHNYQTQPPLRQDSYGQQLPRNDFNNKNDRFYESQYQQNRQPYRQNDPPVSPMRSNEIQNNQQNNQPFHKNFQQKDYDSFELNANRSRQLNSPRMFRPKTNYVENNTWNEPQMSKIHESRELPKRDNAANLDRQADLGDMFMNE